MAFIKVCDMHDLTEWSVEVEATRSFTVNGRSYEIDLCGEHDAALAAVLQPYLDAARKVANVGRANSAAVVAVDARPASSWPCPRSC
jgi:Lsr2 protein